MYGNFLEITVTIWPTVTTPLSNGKIQGFSSFKNGKWPFVNGTLPSYPFKNGNLRKVTVKSAKTVQFFNFPLAYGYYYNFSVKIRYIFLDGDQSCWVTVKFWKISPLLSGKFLQFTLIGPVHMVGYSSDNRRHVSKGNGWFRRAEKAFLY